MPQSTISLTSLSACERFVRFIKDDVVPHGQPIYFVQANHGQSVMIQPRHMVPFVLFHPDIRDVAEIIDTLQKTLELPLPGDFQRGTSIYIVPGLLHMNGVPVLTRILRQQIFLGGSINPLSTEQVHCMVYNAIGNAIWNFMEHRVWNSDVTKKNAYRDLRGYFFDFDTTPGEDGSPRGRTQQVAYQQTLFSVASEDFRYFFADALGGRGEWFYDVGPNPISPPNPEVKNFWIHELKNYIEESAGTVVGM